MPAAFLGFSALCRGSSAQQALLACVGSVSGRAGYSRDNCIDLGWERVPVFHSLPIREELDHVEKVRWKVKRKHRGVETRRYECGFLCSRNSHNSFIQGKKQATLERKGIT